jgi:hypothetical protein
LLNKPAWAVTLANITNMAADNVVNFITAIS